MWRRALRKEKSRFLKRFLASVIICCDFSADRLCIHMCLCEHSLRFSAQDGTAHTHTYTHRHDEPCLNKFSQPPKIWRHCRAEKGFSVVIATLWYETFPRLYHIEQMICQTGFLRRLPISTQFRTGLTRKCVKLCMMKVQFRSIVFVLVWFHLGGPFPGWSRRHRLH